MTIAWIGIGNLISCTKYQIHACNPTSKPGTSNYPSPNLGTETDTQAICYLSCGKQAMANLPCGITQNSLSTSCLDYPNNLVFEDLYGKLFTQTISSEKLASVKGANSLKNWRALYGPINYWTRRNYLYKLAVDDKFKENTPILI